MIVVDTNILAYLYLPGDLTADAEQLLQRDADWAVPLLWRSEFRNILAGFMRREQLSLSEAQDIQSEAETALNGLEFEVDSTAVLELVHASRCSAYDCEFAALARSLGVKLVTQDRALLANFPNFTEPLAVA